MRWVTMLCAVLLLPATASAAVPSTEPSPLAVTPNGTVQALAVSGTTAFIGGDFRHVGPVTGGFAAVDGEAGLLAGSWPVVDGPVSAVAADGAGGWYLGGTFTAVGGVPRAGLAHLLADGTLDAAWDPGVTGFVAALAVLGDRVYVGGQFTAVAGQPRVNLAAVDRVTGAPTTVGASGGAVWLASPSTSRVGAFAVRPAAPGTPARLFVGGRFDRLDGAVRVNLGAYDAAGAVAQDFGDTVAGDGFLGTVNALATVDLGGAGTRLYAGGDFTFWRSTPRARLAAFEPDGSLSAWNPGAPGTVYAVAGTPARVFASTGDAIRAVGAVSGTVDPAWDPDLGVFGTAFALAARGDTVYVGGQFGTLGAGARRTNAAAFLATDSSVLRPWDPEMQGQVSALALGPGDTVAGGGSFTAAGGTPRRNLAAIDLLSGRLLPFAPDMDRAVSALAVHGATLYAGGQFTQVGAATRRRLAAFDVASGALTAFDGDVDGPVSSLAATAQAVYAAGAFSAVNGTLPRSGVAGFDAQTGAARTFAPQTDGSVFALAARGDTVYLGGTFGQLLGLPRDGAGALVDVPGTVGAPTGFAPDTDKFVTDLALDGDVVHLTGQGTAPADRDVQRLDAATGAARGPAQRLTGGLGQSVARAGDLVVVGGLFTGVDAVARRNVAAFDAASGALAEWAPEMGESFGLGGVAALAASPEAGLVAAGSFPRVGAQVTGPLAAFALPPSAPAAPAVAPGDGRATVTVTPPPPGGAPITGYAISVEPGGRVVTTAGPEVVVDGLVNGTAYAFSATATNRVGTSPPSPAATATPVPAAPADTTAPRITALGVTRKRFRLGTRPTAAARRGTAFRFSVSEPARTTIAIARAVPGRRKGGRCVKPRKALKRRCTRFIAAQRLARATGVGANRVAYSGRVGKRRLRPGAHRATLVAVDVAGNRSAPARVAFRVVRR